MSDETPVWDPDGVLPEHERIGLLLHIEDKYGRRRDDFRVIAYTQVLWSGWECDHGIVLIEIDGRREVQMIAGVFHPNDRGAATMLRERLHAYRDAIADTEFFLSRLEGDVRDARVGIGDFLHDRKYPDPGETRRRFALANKIVLHIEKQGLTAEGAAGIAGISASEMAQITMSGAAFTSDALAEILRRLGGAFEESDDGA